MHTCRGLEEADMAAQERTTRNYIDLVDERGDPRRLSDRQPASVRPIKEYLLGLVAAMLTHNRGEAR
jgi:hypothetical protein